MSVSGTVGGSISGLAVYISSQYEESVPSNIIQDESFETVLKDGLPDLNISQEEAIEQYGNKVIVNTYDVNGSAVNIYYKCVWKRDIREIGKGI